MNAVALPITVAYLIDEYAAKNAAIEDAIKDFNDAHQRLGMAATVYGTYAEQVAPSPHLYAASLRKNLLKSGWLDGKIAGGRAGTKCSTIPPSQAAPATLIERGKLLPCEPLHRFGALSRSTTRAGLRCLARSMNPD